MIAFRLLGIHIFASLAIWLSMYIPGLDILLSLVYIIIISQEIHALRPEKLRVKWLAAFLWLSIPLIFSVITCLNINDLGIFILSFWLTPFIPLISIKTYVFANAFPLYYYIFLALPFVLIIYYYLLIRIKNK